MSLTQKATDYLREVRTEMSKVSWPNRTEIRQATIVVLVAVAILASFVFVVDQAFVRLLGLLFS